MGCAGGAAVIQCDWLHGVRRCRGGLSLKSMQPKTAPNIGLNTTAFARLEDPIGRRFRSARKPRVSACPMTIEREFFGWKFAAAGAAGDLAASCSVLRAARPKTQWTRRLNGPECAG